MCGIVAAVARRNVVPILLEGLKRLEYRGYDSAGVAVVNGTLKRLRSPGRIAELARLANEHGLSMSTTCTTWRSRSGRVNGPPHDATTSLTERGISRAPETLTLEE